MPIGVFVKLHNTLSSFKHWWWCGDGICRTNSTNAIVGTVYDTAVKPKVHYFYFVRLFAYFFYPFLWYKTPYLSGRDGISGKRLVDVVTLHKSKHSAHFRDWISCFQDTQIKMIGESQHLALSMVYPTSSTMDSLEFCLFPSPSRLSRFV